MKHPVVTQLPPFQLFPGKPGLAGASSVFFL